MTFDSSSPSPAKRPLPIGQRIAVSLMLVLTLSFIGTIYFSRHFPSLLGRLISLTVASVFGLLVAWRMSDGALGSAARSRLKLLNGSGAFIATHAWLRIFLTGIAAFVFVFVDIEEGLFSLVTATIGRPATRTVTISGMSGGGRTCRKFDVLEVKLLLDGALCAASEQRSQAIHGRHLTLVGKESVLGLNVEGFQLGPRP
jgi:hypothetical protein